MGVLWFTAIVAFVIIEASTVQFVSIWFAGGALAAFIADLLGVGAAIQWIVFVLSSAVLLTLTRPLVKKLANKEASVTGTDLLIGKTVIMTKATDSRGEAGEAKIDGKYWTVNSIDGQSIAEGTVVTIEKIEGVKLIVRK